MIVTQDDKVDSFLEHQGVKGMKWGVRKDRGHEGETAKTKVINKADKKFEKSFSGTSGFVKVNNAIAEGVNSRIGALNDKPEFQGDLTKNPASLKKYNNEFKKIVEKSASEAMSQFGSNASGTKRVNISIEGDANDPASIGWSYKLEDIKHAASDGRMLVKPKRKATGQIISVTITEDEGLEQSDDVDDFLEHFGVKGMKWGHRSQTISEARTARRGVKADFKAAKTAYDSATTAKGKTAALNVLKKAEKADWENKNVARSMKRGEQILAGVAAAIFLTPIGGAAAIAGKSIYSRNSKQFKSKYDD